MARKAMIEKEKRRENAVRRDWEKRQALKKAALDFSRSEEEREDARNRLNKLSPNGASVRLRNRCLLTGRCRGYLRKFKLSRLTFREMASQGLIPGITKASW